MVDYIVEYERWLSSSYISDEERQELAAIKDNDGEIKSRFFKPLEFGTAGLRGIMGAGINRMNAHVIKQATQGLAEIILQAGGKARERGVVICHDCRIKSREFALEAAKVMAGNGIYVRIFEDLRPTPELSFAVRYYGAIAGINITASHNPKEYNGYKVYWEDGAQLPPEHAEQVAAAMGGIDVLGGARQMALDKAERQGLVEVLGEETDEIFLSKVLEQAIDPGGVAKGFENLKIAYTPFHGTGYRLVPEALRRLGVRELFCIPEQMQVDGSFPTVTSPNPEDEEGFSLALEYARRQESDIIIGTDPDSDRLAVMVRADGDYRLITGNQLGVLLLNYIIEARKRKGTLPANAAALKTIVSTEMARAVAEANGVYITDTFTGFKFMAEKIKEFEETGSYRVIFSFEESIGYMIGDFVRDKDAVTCAVLVAEMAAWYRLRGMSLSDALDELYERYGYYAEKTVNLVMPGLDGLENMKRLMASLRKSPPDAIGGRRVVRVRDYLEGTARASGGSTKEPLPIKGSDVLYFELEDESLFIVRPSGTEPKIKIYNLVRGESKEDCDRKIKAAMKEIEDIKEKYM